MKSVGLEVPNVEVRFEDLNVVADVQTGSRALPTLINYTRDVLEVEYFVLLPFLTVLDKTWLAVSGCQNFLPFIAIDLQVTTIYDVNLIIANAEYPY